MIQIGFFQCLWSRGGAAIRRTSVCICRRCLRRRMRNDVRRPLFRRRAGSISIGVAKFSARRRVAEPTEEEPSLPHFRRWGSPEIPDRSAAVLRDRTKTGRFAVADSIWAFPKSVSENILDRSFSSHGGVARLKFLRVFFCLFFFGWNVNLR